MQKSKGKKLPKELPVKHLEESLMGSEFMFNYDADEEREELARVNAAIAEVWGS